MPSLTEWMERIEYKDIDKFREEDNTKRDRLEILFQKIGLVYDRPERMLATDITNKTSVFKDIYNRKAKEKCALRLVPTKIGLPKLRQRGKTLEEYINNWFNTLVIDPNFYKVEVVPHSDDVLYSTIFIISDKGIYGEIVKKGHWQLTQGFFNEELINFSYDFKKWNFSQKDGEVEKTIKNIINLLKISEKKAAEIKKELDLEINERGYLKGYFEVVEWPQSPLFVDYNRIINKMLPDFVEVNSCLNKDEKLFGICASKGKINGVVRIVLDPLKTDFVENEILVCSMTTIDYVPLMKKASAIITDQGNILSHAAIVSRELGIPCVVNTKNATEILFNGDFVEVDADKGVIKIINLYD